jgi:hypothetical protein
MQLLKLSFLALYVQFKLALTVSALGIAQAFYCTTKARLLAIASEFKLHPSPPH